MNERDTIPPVSELEQGHDFGNIGLVIQGPLHSRGRSGATADIKRHNIEDADIVNFDCIENIKALTSAYPGFGRVVCVLWSSETARDIAAIERAIGAKNVLVIDDNTKDVRPKKGLLPGNNKYRQFLSSLKGAEVMAAQGLEYTIKIRSDQRLDLYQLATDLRKIAAVRGKFIMVPRIHAGSSSDHLADFYIGGHTADLIRCFDTYLKAPERYRNVHTDIFYGFAAALLGPPNWPPRMLGLKTNMAYVRKAWNALYCPASYPVLQALSWRGAPTPINHAKNKFLDDLPPDLRVEKSMLLKRPTSG